MSRPSITTPPPSPAFCCSATSNSRTPAIVASREAACATSPVRISVVTSRPSRNTRFFNPAASCSAVGAFNSICVSRVSSSSAASSSSGIFRSNAFSATARYIAPLSRYKYPSIAATRRATVLFPDPAGPSIAIVNLRANPPRFPRQKLNEARSLVPRSILPNFALRFTNLASRLPNPASC